MPTPLNPHLRFGAIASCLTVAAIALYSAATWYAHPVAGVLVDPGGHVSNFGMAGWAGERERLKFPDAVVSVDGRRLVASDGSPPAQVWDRAVETAWASGRRFVDAVVETPTGTRHIRLPIHALEPLAWWTYAGGLIFAGMLYIAAGLTALSVSPRSPLARTFAKVGISSGLLGVLSFDFHTTRHLVLLFFVAFGLLPLSWVALALRLPDDAPILRRYPWFERALDAAGVGVALALVTLYLMSRETAPLQYAWTLAWGGAFVLFGITFLVRFALSEGIRRARLRALLISVVPVHVVALGVLAFPGTGSARLSPLVQAGSYAMLALFPLATAYAFIRYDLWGSRAILSRILTRLAVGGVVCGLAIGIGTFVAVRFGAVFRDALFASGLAAVCSSVLVVAALRAADRFLFVARERYKPTVDQLGEELISITSPDEVARAIERTIRRWLPCEYVELVVDPDAQAALETRSGLRRTSSWNVQLTAKSSDPIVMPIDFGGTRLGTLRIGEKRGHALFTNEDLDLLRTIVNQGALALAHAFAYQELETRRREQAAAWRGERAALIETVAAEIAHEIRYPINFFKMFFASDRDATSVDAEDLEIGREEVERLERLVSGLKRMATRTMRREPVPLETLCARVEVLLRDALREREIARTNLANVSLSCDPDQMTQILVNLAANGLQAAGDDGAVGFEWRAGSEGPELVVWDNGDGFDGDPDKLFAPWYTTKEKGTGLGLAITHRLVRAHDWNIKARRVDGRTEFVIKVRRTDVVIEETERRRSA